MKPARRRIMHQGLVAGLLGFFTVAVIFATVNVVSGRSPFYTSALLGAVLFHGASDPAQASVTARYVLEYSAAHLAVFILLGLLTSALAAVSDRGWQLWFVALFILIFASFHLEAAVQIFARPARVVLPEAAIWGVGLAASAVMAAYLVWMHPRSARRSRGETRAAEAPRRRAAHYPGDGRELLHGADLTSTLA